MAQQRIRPSVELASVPVGFPKDWKLIVDGIEVGYSLAEMVLDNPEKVLYRNVQLGLVGSEGNEYVAIAYYEFGGGGTVPVSFAWIGGNLFVGAARQHRLLMGPNPVLCAPGGYKAPTDASDRETGEREMREEVSADRRVILRTFMLEGDPMNPNRAVFITAGDGEGVTYFGVEINPEFLEAAQDGYRFVEGAGRVDQGVEKVLGMLFIPVVRALRSADGLLNVGAGRLIAHLGLV